MLMRSPSLSIRTLVLGAIVVGVVLPALALLWIDEGVARRTQEPVLQRSRVAALTQAAAAMTEPAWTLNRPALEQAMDQALQLPGVCGVSLSDLQPFTEQPTATPMALQRWRCVQGVEPVRLDTPVAFDAVDDRPVDLLFALFAPPKDGAEHLRALAAVSRALRSSELREQLRQARTTDAVRALFVKDQPATTAA